MGDAHSPENRILDGCLGLYLQVHNVDYATILEFPSESELDRFRQSLHKTQFVLPRGRELLENGDLIATYVCRRSNETNFHTVKRAERLIRTHSSVKLDEFCLCRLRVIFHRAGTVSATFYNHHTGHDPDTDHYRTFRLGASVLSTIDRMLIQQIPALRIQRNLNAALRDRDTREDALQVFHQYNTSRNSLWPRVPIVQCSFG